MFHILRQSRLGRRRKLRKSEAMLGAVDRLDEADSIQRRDFLDVTFDLLSIDRIVAILADAPGDIPFRYIVTPNVDHVVQLSRTGGESEDLRTPYRLAWLRLCDSRVLARLARLRGIHLPLVPGSDLTARFFADAIREDDRIAIIGSSASAVAQLAQRHPGVTFLHHAPPMGLRRNPAAIDAAARFVAESRARVTFLVMGSPQQEMVAARVAQIGGATGIGLCVGAAIDFLVGNATRAPVMLQKMGLEWAYRLLTSPRRLWRRYLVEGPRVFLLFARWRPR